MLKRHPGCQNNNCAPNNVGFGAHPIVIFEDTLAPLMSDCAPYNLTFEAQSDTTNQNSD